MQTHNSSAVDRRYDILQPSSPMTPSPFSVETGSKDSSPQQRWRSLFLICSSTFGVYFLESLLGGASKEKFSAFNVYERTDMVDTQLLMGYLSFLPLFAGLMISYYGIRKVFGFFMKAGVCGSLFVILSFKVKVYFLYVFSQTLIRGSILALWVAQVYMITKLFKGKELSLAIGILGVWKSISSFTATQLSSYITMIGLLKLLCLVALICIVISVMFLKRIDLVIEQVEGGAVSEERSLNQPATNALMAALVCFAVGEGARTIYFSIMFPSHSEALITTIAKSESFDIFAPIFLLPLFGTSADKDNRRTLGVFSSFILLLIGSTFFYLFASPESVPISLLASTLFLIGSCLFEVSFWAVLGSSTPQKRLAVVLGMAFSLKQIAPRFFGPYLGSLEKWLGFTVGIFLVLGIKAMSFALKEFEKKEEENKLKGDDTTQMVETDTV